MLVEVALAGRISAALGSARQVSRHYAKPSCACQQKGAALPEGAADLGVDEPSGTRFFDNRLGLNHQQLEH